MSQSHLAGDGIIPLLHCTICTDNTELPAKYPANFAKNSTVDGWSP